MDRGTRSVVFIDEVTIDGISRMNSVWYRAILSALIQPNIAKMMALTKK